jgi:hypothetical protein
MLTAEFEKQKNARNTLSVHATMTDREAAVKRAVAL